MSLFHFAKPIWAQGLEKEINLRLQFKEKIPSLNNALIKIATSGTYQLKINKKFIAYGPARAGLNHFRMDELNISDYLNKSINEIIIEVCGYNTNSFAIQNQPSFLQCEIISDEKTIRYTGKDFKVSINPNYYRKTQRYSFQRPMMESYHFDTVSHFPDKILQTCETQEKTILKRNVPYPKYENLNATFFSKGIFEFDYSKEIWTDRSIENIGEQLIGFNKNELNVFPTNEVSQMIFIESSDPIQNKLFEKQYQIYKLPYVSSGFISFNINCHSNTQIYLLFDEILTNNYVDFSRLECANVIRFDFCPGKHNVLLFEPYTMQYLQFVVKKGCCNLENTAVIEYKNPLRINYNFPDDKLNLIAKSAIETYRQNAVDIFTDCPSRERAGWLCDSFFEARTEYFLTGKSVIEKNFLENFLHEEKYKCLPDGMFPMCYPADFYNGEHIPQWSLWLVLQLYEYFQRSNDTVLIDRYKHKIDNLFNYFSNFENEDGLLENLEGWNFVEWSKANEFVNGVNYPTNMLYCKALKYAGILYNNSQYINKSIKRKSKILTLSFNGKFFVDNAVRNNGVLHNTNNMTEVCQYYAFFFDIADTETHKDLFNILLDKFGPERDSAAIYPDVFPAAPFIGYFLRLELLSKTNHKKLLKQNIIKYYYDMAKTTGTLWEHADKRASCCHGFSSYILCWLK